MADEPHHLDITASLERMEPGIAHVPVEMSLASIAVSLKDISWTLREINTSLQHNGHKLDSIQISIGSMGGGSPRRY